MKTEKTLENKQRFFAIYWGQDVKKTPHLDFLVFVNQNNICSNIKESYLELTPLSQISDEDAIEVLKIWGSEVDSKILGFIIASRIIEKSENEVRNTIGVVDYLRSKGYALPFMDLSIEQLIDYGWLKLKQC